MILKKFRTIDESLAWMDQMFEDRLRELRTALVLDIPASGVDVDHDIWASSVMSEAAASVTGRAHANATQIVRLMKLIFAS
jgi:hypothetical protein